MPVRCGYWVADRLATQLLGSGATPRELLQMPYERAVTLARQWLERL